MAMSTQSTLEQLGRLINHFFWLKLKVKYQESNFNVIINPQESRYAVEALIKTLYIPKNVLQGKLSFRSHVQLFFRDLISGCFFFEFLNFNDIEFVAK